MSRSIPTVATGLLLAGAALQGAARADERWLPMPPPPYVPVRVVPVLLGPVPYVDLRSGRCLAGFARDVSGVCVRHDEPDVICDPTSPALSPCAVALPNPRPYGLGPSLRLNY